MAQLARSRRQYQIERALYKAAGNPTGVDAVDQAATSLMASGMALPRIEAPKGKAPDPFAE